MAYKLSFCVDADIESVEHKKGKLQGVKDKLALVFDNFTVHEGTAPKPKPKKKK